jgi:hypothetical protein
MVAITMLTVSFLGISVLLSKSLAVNRVTANDVTATYLASEGIEITKNLIDHDVYAGYAHQGNGWGSCFLATQDFEVEYSTNDCRTLVSFGNGGHVLLYDASAHLYNYENGTPTIFTREIRVVPTGSYEVTVIAIVSWSGLNGAPGNISLEDHFYKWYSE